MFIASKTDEIGVPLLYWNENTKASANIRPETSPARSFERRRDQPFGGATGQVSTWVRLDVA